MRLLGQFSNTVNETTFENSWKILWTKSYRRQTANLSGDALISRATTLRGNESLTQVCLQRLYPRIRLNDSLSQSFWPKRFFFKFAPLLSDATLENLISVCFSSICSSIIWSRCATFNQVSLFKLCLLISLLLDCADSKWMLEGFAYAPTATFICTNQTAYVYSFHIFWSEFSHFICAGQTELSLEELWASSHAFKITFLSIISLTQKDWNL